jgi:hypothetical protein
MHLEVHVTIDQCARAKKILLEDTIIKQAGNFLRIPAYLKRLKFYNLGLHTRFTQDVTGRFLRATIIFSRSDHLFQCSIPWARFDGTWLKLCYKQVLLTAIGRDGNNETNIYSVSVTEGENNLSWAAFTKDIATSMPSIKMRAFSYQAFNSEGPMGAPCSWQQIQECPKISMISDGDKGAQNGITAFGRNVNVARYYWHMAKNVLEKHGKQAQDYFWELVYTQSRGQFLIILGRIERDCGVVYIISLVCFKCLRQLTKYQLHRMPIPISSLLTKQHM